MLTLSSHHQSHDADEKTSELHLESRPELSSLFFQTLTPPADFWSFYGLLVMAPVWKYLIRFDWPRPAIGRVDSNRPTGKLFVSLQFGWRALELGNGPWFHRKLDFEYAESCHWSVLVKFTNQKLPCVPAVGLNGF